ncbi:hypothetical protein C2869_06160 [Saccharobesus litoralis]|uniref:Uncharacterized protein n=1 Tax=Saccharobesus litoralis TaxID=2172099 RepID=A0A2S0VPA1_9ALTE|nr:hypothetical protein [Saccharobesus litoralis]AWB66047.1 hypothetical protein C2869_06160 [Saccharobesus litoralis]
MTITRKRKTNRKKKTISGNLASISASYINLFNSIKENSSKRKTLSKSTFAKLSKLLGKSKITERAIVHIYDNQNIVEDFGMSREDFYKVHFDFNKDKLSRLSQEARILGVIFDDVTEFTDDPGDALQYLNKYHSSGNISDDDTRRIYKQAKSNQNQTITLRRIQYLIDETFTKSYREELPKERQVQVFNHLMKSKRLMNWRG